MSVIGAGKAGSVLARFARLRGYRIDTIVSRSAESARALGSQVQARRAGDWSSALSPKGILLFALPDEAIRDAASELARRGAFPSAACHTSGIRDAAELAPLEGEGRDLFSFHPLQTFYSAAMEPELCAGIGVGIEGAPAALGRARNLAADFGWHPVVVAPGMKAAYHAGCVFASNFVTVLSSLAAELIASAGGLDSPATAVILPILRTAVEAVAREAPEKVLTGPAARGDLETLLRHADALSRRDPALARLYADLTAAALRLAAAGGKITAAQAVTITNALSKFSEKR